MGKYLWIDGIFFPYGQEVIARAVESGQAVTFRFVRRLRKGKPAWYVHVTVRRLPSPMLTRRDRGAIGADLNDGMVAAVRVDRYGNPLSARRFPMDLAGKTRAQREAILGEVVADLVAWAKSEGVPICVEELDFEKKKAALRELSKEYARMLSGFPYRTFHRLVRARAAREGVEVIEVGPEYTTVIGGGKFGIGYRLNPHCAAAVAIARRGLGFGERLCGRLGSALPLPARNRGRHVLDDWGRFSRWLVKRGGLALLLGRRPQARRPDEGETPIRGGTFGRPGRPAADGPPSGSGGGTPGAKGRESCSPGLHEINDHA